MVLNDFKDTNQGGVVLTVSNSNIGKGIKWDEATQKYQVALGDTLTVGENGLVDVKLSSDSGNLLEARKNGLYYGQTPKVEVTNLYVSSTLGNDANSGTKESPFKTIHRALNAIAENKTSGIYTVRLRAGETFEFPLTRVWFSQTTLHLNIGHYDDPNYPDFGAVIHGVYQSSYAPDLKRPILIYSDFIREDGLLRHAGYDTAGEFVLRHYGLNVKYNLRRGSVFGFGFYHEELVYEGCVIDLDDTECIGSAKVIRLRGNRFNNTNKNITNLFISDLSPNIWVLDPFVEQGKSGGKAKDFTPMLGNEKSVFYPENIMALSAFNRSTKSLFGYTVNWDIFDNP